MAIIDKRFLFYTTEAGFLSDKNKGNIDDKSIAFISAEGKRAIYTHGVYFSPEAFVVGTQTSSTNAFTGEFNEVDKLYDGLSIKYWIPFDGTTSDATLNLTINGTATGAIPVYIKGTTRFTNHIGAYNVLHLTYRKNVGSISEGWWVLGSYGDASDGNTTYSFTSGEDGSFKVRPSDGPEQTISVGKPKEAETADKVEKTFTIQINSGTEEDVSFYEFDGSAARYLNIKSGDNVKFGTEDGELVISGNYQNATTAASGLMSSSDKSKLDNIAANAEVNQNTFANVKVGDTTVGAESKTDTLEIEAGTNVTIAADETSKKITISATDTTYNNATTSTAGLMSAEDKTKLDNLSGALDANVMYNSSMDDSLKTLSALGGIPAGTTAENLKKKTLSQVFDDLLFPTVQPTVSAPSASISFKSTTTTPTVQEVGTTGSTVPTPSSFSTSFSKGSISINGTKKQDRSGNATTTIIYHGGNTSNTSNFPTVIPDGSISYNCRISYEAGPTPLDSKGNPATNYTALPAGSVTSGAVTVYGVYPYYNNASNNSSFSKMSLTTGTTFSALKFKAEGPNKHAFKLPAKYKLTKTELLNTLSGKYETFATSNWTVTTEDITVQGNVVSYKVYTRNDSGFNGESTYNITFSK